MKSVNHTERKHSLISPSGAKRWILCPASVSFEEQFGREETSEYATEGTLAHEIADVKLRMALYPKDTPFGLLQPLLAHPQYYEGMQDEVQEYIDKVLEDVYDGCTVYLEERLDLSFLYTDMKGHNDFAVYNPTTRRLIVSDLKFGAGVKVHAHNNEQLMLYALGIWDKLRMEFIEVDSIQVQIIQPRMEHFDTYIFTVDELHHFERVTLREAFKKIDAEKPMFKSGKHCQFCKAKAKCPELASAAKEAYEASEQYFNGELVLDSDSYEYYLALEDSIKKFMSAIRDEIYAILTEGGEVTNFKLVEGRSRRYFTDEDKVIERLRALEFTDEDIYDTKLKSLTGIEKRLGKKTFKKELDEYIDKTKGNVSVAHADDTRREISSEVEHDFGDINLDLL